MLKTKKQTNYVVSLTALSIIGIHILVREVHYTDTGWAMLGDETGYFPDGQAKDIVLSGKNYQGSNSRSTTIPFYVL